jgi:hypothetical protein
LGTTAVAEEGAVTGAQETEVSRVPAYLPPLVAAVIAAALSIPRLGSRTMWLDEAYTVGATTELLDTWRATGGTQAIYYLLLWPVTHISTDAAVLRVPSALFALAALGVVHEVGRRIGGARVGALAAGGMALSWGLARYSIETRSYTLALLLVSLSWLALVTLVMRGDPSERGGWWRLFFVATLLAPLAHGLSVLHLAVQLTALLAAPHGRRWLRRMVPVLVALGVELLALAALGAGDVGDWVAPLAFSQIVGLGQLMLGFGVTGMALTALTAVAGVDTLRRFRQERTVEAWGRLVPVFWAFGPLIVLVTISLVRPYAAPRYVFSALPGFFLLMAVLVARLRSVRVLTAAALLIAVLLLADQGRVTTMDLENWEGMTACIAANAVDGDRVLVTPVHRPPVDYYWPRVTDEDTPDVTSISPDRLGDVKRIYEPWNDVREILLADSGSGPIWYAERSHAGRIGIAGLAFDDEIRDRYDMTRAWYFEGSLTLVRLDPRDGTQVARPSVPCDTIRRPGS